MPVSVLKEYQNTKRNHLFKLIDKAYKCTQKSPEVEREEQERHLLSLLGFIENQPPFAIKQAEKYNRYQFVLPTLPDWDDAPEEDSEQAKRQQAFKLVFGDEHAKKNYRLLQKEHPDGVECWVNPPEASKHPLIENNLATSADSILVAAEALLEKSKQQQTELLKSVTQESEHGDVKARVDTRAQEVLANIRHQRQSLDKLIKKLYEYKKLDDDYSKKSRFVRFFSRKPKSPFEKQFELVQKRLITFHRYTVAQLAQFEQVDHRKPSEKDYKKLFKRLARAEQQVKLASEKLPDQAIQFNQDIFAIHIDNEDKKTFQYHDRHYYLTEWQKSEQKIEKDHKITTATAHSPEYLLSNYTMVEEGTISGEDEAAQVSIDHIGTRSGSHSPSELHKGSYQQYDKHLATYHALNNMEQTQIAIRVKRIESLLSEVIPDNAVKRIEISEKIALKISQQVHEKHIHGTGFTLDKVIDESLNEIEDIDIHKEDIKRILDENKEKIINPANYHTHLITAPGLGGISENQRYQFYSARLAQYATQDGKGGIFYLCNGVNTMRWDSFFFDANAHKVKGNNAVAMVEMFKFLNLSYPGVVNANPIGGTGYEELLTNVRKYAANYFATLENSYLPAKKKVDDKIAEIAQLEQQQNSLKKLQKQTPKNNKILNQLRSVTDKLEQAKTQLKADQYELRLVKDKLDNQRSVLRRNESHLHLVARQINKTIYNVIKAKNGLTGQWAIYQICQNLFSGTNFAGIDNWKLSANNGMFQALVQLLTDDTDLFASSGCKSANDRELFVALLLTELIKEKKVCEENDQTFNLEYFNAKKTEIRDTALKQLHTHISNHQTQKDRSALPKTNDSILVNGNKVLKSDLKNADDPTNYASLSERLKIAKLAAHKRKSKAADDLNISAMHFYGTHSATRLPSLLRKRWLQSPQAKKDKGLTQAIYHAFVVDSGHGDEAKYKGIINYVNRFYSEQTLLKNWLNLHQHCAQKLQRESSGEAADEVSLKETLKEQLDAIAEGIRGVQGNYGDGFKQMKKLFHNYKTNNDYSVQDRISILMTLQEIALPRANDWTSSFHQNNSFFRHFKSDRPKWLRDLYTNISTLCNDENIDFESMTQNIAFPEAHEQEHLVQNNT